MEFVELQDSELEGKSLEELTAMRDAL
jgi:hypothetical protein